MLFLDDEEQNETDVLSALIMQEYTRYKEVLAQIMNENSHQNIAEEWRKHNFTMIALRSRRVSILIGCPWMDNEWVGKQLTDLLESIKALYRKETIDRDVLSDALDSLRAVADENISDERFLSLLPRKLKRKAKHLGKELSPIFVSLLYGVAEVWLARSETKRASKILQYLVGASRVRNASDPEKHGELVAVVLSKLVERDWEAAASICDSEAAYFVDREDDAAGDYLWFRAGINNFQKNIPSAKADFEQCYQLRRSLYGERDWYTSMPRMRLAVLSMSSENAEEHYRFFIRFVHDILDGSITGPDQRMLDHEKGTALYFILIYQNKHHVYDGFMAYWQLYEALCREYNETPSEGLLKLRLCYNLLGRYYFQSGDLLQAEQAFKDALFVQFPEGTEEIITEIQVASNVLMVFLSENDLDAAFPLLDELVELSEDADEPMSERDRYRIWNLQASILQMLNLPLKEEVLHQVKSHLISMKRELEVEPSRIDL